MLGLGQAIVRELELDRRGAVLERWLAHHLAELISEAERAVGPAKAAAEQKAVDLILKLWTHRRALPEPVDPLGGYRNAIAVLSRLVPDADPWGRLHRDEPYEELLHEMFQALSRIVLGGILLTQFTRARSISEAEARALGEEEAFLQAELERWMSFVTAPPQTPKVQIKIVDPNAAEDTEEPNSCPTVDDNDVTTEQQAAQAEASVHSAICANLERMQTDLTNLLARWKKVAPNESEPDDDW